MEITAGISSPTAQPAIAATYRARRVLIIDNHPIENQQDLMVCAEADTARDARIAIKEFNPDVIVADIGLNQGDGIELVRDVRAHHEQLPILVLSSHDEAVYAERMLSVGANGYIMKDATSEQILHSLRRVLAGAIYVSEDVGYNMIRKSALRGALGPASPIDRLTDRELQILHLVGKGMSSRETARVLNLSVKTVESHRHRIKYKLNLASGAQLVQFAINWFTCQESGPRTFPVFHGEMRQAV
jgi:DNA-binding NarL/FixJ family response regulator